MLVFGAVTGLGELIVHYGGSNALGDRAIPLLMFGELLLFLASAALIARPRPDVPKLDPHLPTAAYPSGHVAATICLYTAIVLLVLPRTRAWWRWLTLVPAVAMPVLVAAARMYRGMHHPTDLLGSVVLAGLWVSAVYLTIRPNADLAESSSGVSG